jgi:hypothetical protein
MKILVKLYATLRKFAPPDNELGEFFEVEFNGATINSLPPIMSLANSLKLSSMGQQSPIL